MIIDVTIKLSNVHTTTEVEKTRTQPPISISPSELTPKQLLHLTQAHISSTYDLRTDQQLQNTDQTLRLRHVTLSDTDDQHIDLFRGGQTTPQQAILLQQANNDSNDNMLDTFRSKLYKDYLSDNSKNTNTRRPTPHQF